METQTEERITLMKQEIEKLKQEIKDLKKKFEHHRHDGHGFIT